MEDKPYTSRPSAVHDQHAAARSQPQAGLHGPADDGGGAEPVRKRPHHLHAHRLDQPGQVAIDAARDLVDARVRRRVPARRAARLSDQGRNAQEAHEAIRPAGHPFELPEQLRGELSPDEFKLFDLIWKRTIASQMADARGHRITITIEGDGAVFQVSGKTIDFPGFLRAYVEGSDDPEADLADRETVLPQMTVGEELDCSDLETKSHTTQPPARFSEAALTASLEEMGIGRPSTYASIIDTILARDMSSRRERAGADLDRVRRSQLLEAHLPKLVDYEFTAQMEDDLDAISRGERENLAYLRDFYFGNGTSGLKPHSTARSRDRRPPRQPHPPRQARRTKRKSSSASGAMVRSSSKATAAPRFPRARRPTS